MPGKMLEVGQDGKGNIAVNFEPDIPRHTWHAIFTPDEAENFARLLLKHAGECRAAMRAGDAAEEEK